MKKPNPRAFLKQKLTPIILDKVRKGSDKEHRLIRRMMKVTAKLGKEAPGITYLHEQLRIAMMLELSTIPPYMTALYSLMEGDKTAPDYEAEFGDNATVAGIIRSVMIEEMLHFTLVGNILNAIQGEIKVTDPEFVPDYPTALPDSAGMFEVGIRKFDKEAIQTFLHIEEPTPPDTLLQFEGYQTIGQFYDAIIQLMKLLENAAQANGTTIFKGYPALQVDKSYYSGGGEIIEIHNLASALAAFEVILDQGEGSQTDIYNQDEKNFGKISDLAHYFKFNEVYEERRYASTQKDPTEAPQGEKLHIKYDKVYPMLPNPRTADFVSAELIALSHAFNQKYSQMLHALQDGFFGQQSRIQEAIDMMFELKPLAMQLMQSPIPGKAFHAGPTFEYMPPTEG